MKINVEKLVLGAVNTNMYLVSYNGFCLIIDPSAEAGRIVSLIEERGEKPLAVLLTHGHFDHVMAAQELSDKYGIKIYAGEKELPLLSDPEINLSAPFLGKEFTLSPDVLLKDGEELQFEGFWLKAIETKGHTAGSISFYSDDLSENEGFKHVIFSGDSVFAGSIGRCDFPTSNEKEMRKTINEIFKKLPDDTVIFSGHGPATTVGHEKDNNPFFL